MAEHRPARARWALHGRPRYLATDNGPTFLAATILTELDRFSEPLETPREAEAPAPRDGVATGAAS